MMQIQSLSLSNVTKFEVHEDSENEVDELRIRLEEKKGVVLIKMENLSEVEDSEKLDVVAEFHFIRQKSGAFELNLELEIQNFMTVQTNLMPFTDIDRENYQKRITYFIVLIILASAAACITSRSMAVKAMDDLYRRSEGQTETNTNQISLISLTFLNVWQIGLAIISALFAVAHFVSPLTFRDLSFTLSCQQCGCVQISSSPRTFWLTPGEPRPTAASSHPCKPGADS